MARTPTEREKRMAQEYARAALAGKGPGGYISPSQVANAVYNAAEIEEVVQPKKTTTSAGSGGGSATYNAYAAAIDEQNRLLREQQELAEKQRRAAMEATINANNQAADKSLKEAYVANMLSKRNLPQQLKALGISGGASETTLADIDNTYMNNRFGIEENRNDANLQARLAYDNGVAGDYSEYLSKAYELQGNLASKAKASGGTTTKTKTADSVSGYKIGGSSKVYTDADSLIADLKGMGMTEQMIREYLTKVGLYG